MPERPTRPAPDSRVSASGARESHFLAILSRMKYIERWALMRSSRPENLSEHAIDVALIAHMLATLGRVRHGRDLDADRAAVLGLFHDASEIITGDMPTPVKYTTPRSATRTRPSRRGRRRGCWGRCPRTCAGRTPGTSRLLREKDSPRRKATRTCGAW